jgi:hypothetical protein
MKATEVLPEAGDWLAMLILGAIIIYVLLHLFVL